MAMIAHPQQLGHQLLDAMLAMAVTMLCMRDRSSQQLEQCAQHHSHQHMLKQTSAILVRALYTGGTIPVLHSTSCHAS
jgi:hypothetical protein